MVDESKALVTTGGNVPQKLPKTPNREMVTRSRAMSSGGTVGHLSMEEIRNLIEAIKEISGERLAPRNSLLVKVLFDGCLRCSEALSLRPVDIIQNGDKFRLRIIGKGSKPGEVALSPSIAMEMQAYAFQTGMKHGDAFFPISRRRVHQLIAQGLDAAGIRKPDRVGAVHLLRHTGAIERLRRTGNPRSIQHQLRHSDGAMTLRYLKTLESEASIQIQEEVDLW